MAKMMKLYKLNLDHAKNLNIGHFNPTCKAILKAMYRIEKNNLDHGHNGTTGEDILRFAVKNGLWFTRQVPEKYHTTWAYYVKLLKEKAGVIEVGSVKGLSTEEYLDQDDDEPADFSEAAMEDLMDDPNEDDEDDSEDAATKAEEEYAARLEDLELEKMIAEEAHTMAAE